MTRHLSARLAVVATLVIVLLALLAHVQAQKPASQAELRLGKALNQEDVSGNLKDAIATYEQVLKAPDATRAQKARAQFRIGACYERLGIDGARKAYELVVANYGDMTDFASQAKSRLATMGLGAGPGDSRAPVARLLWEDDAAPYGVVSPDGRLFAYDVGAKIRNLATGESRQLIVESKDGLVLADVVWSRDSKQLGYVWLPRGDQPAELRVIDASGGTSRTLIARPEMKVGQLFDWSPNGQSIAIQLGSVVSGVFAVANLADGAIRELRKTGRDAGYVYRARFSPDGRHLAVSVTGKTNREARDVVLVAADGSGETVLTDAKWRDEVVGWTPDASGVVFVSDRGGSGGVWVIGVTSGRASGEPRLLKADLGQRAPRNVQVAKNGTVFYGLSGVTLDAMVATLDPTSGRVVTPPSLLVPQLAGLTKSASWSPDGRRVAFLSNRPSAGASMTSQSAASSSLSVLDVTSGLTTTFSLPIALDDSNALSVPALRWSSDGEWVISSGNDGKTYALYRIAIRTGETKALATRPGTDYGAILSLDGKRVYYARNPPRARTGSGELSDGTGSIFVRDLATDQEQELYRNDESGFIPAFIALSPDGTWLAFYCRTSGASGSGSALKVISISDHTARSVYRSVNGSIGGIAWMPDSKSLALSVRGSGESGSVSSIWLAPIDGGPAMKTALEVGANILSPSLGPDGQRLLYTVVGSKPGQLWALENVLPQAKAGATKK